MKKYIGKRIMISLVTLLIIILVLFMLLQLMPGSPFNDEKLTGTRFFNRTEMEVSLEITYDTPKSPCSRFFTYVKNCTINGLSSPYFFDIIAI